MSSIEDGLQFYSTIKSLVFILIFLILCCCVSYGYYIYYNKNYKLAKNGNISYKHIDSSGNILYTCDINNSTSDCRYIYEYDDITNNHYVFVQQPITDPKKLPSIGNTQFYYENLNPVNYVNSSIEPSNFILIILCVIFIILLFAIFNLYLIRSNRGYGAVVGSIQVASDIASIFKRKK